MCPHRFFCSAGHIPQKVRRDSEWQRGRSLLHNYSNVLPSKLLCSLLIYAGSLISSGSLSSCVTEKYDQKVCSPVLFVLWGRKHASVKTLKVSNIFSVETGCWVCTCCQPKIISYQNHWEILLFTIEKLARPLKVNSVIEGLGTQCLCDELLLVFFLKKDEIKIMADKVFLDCSLLLSILNHTLR